MTLKAGRPLTSLVIASMMLLSASAHDLAVAGAQAVERRSIVLRGPANHFVDVSLVEEHRLSPVLTITEADQATSIGATAGSWVGYHVMRLPSFESVTGFVQIGSFEPALGGPATIATLGERESVLSPGRYRFVLLGDGAGEVRIATETPGTDLVLDARTPHPTAGGTLVESGVAAGELERRSTSDARVELGSRLVVATQIVFDEAGQRETESCLSLRDNGRRCQSFEDDGGITFAQTSPKHRSLTASLVVPSDSYDPGVYRHELIAKSYATDDMEVRHLFLTVGPGPRDVPVLPGREGSETPSLAAPRQRDLADACSSSDTPTRFSDTAGTTHQAEIDCVARYGIVGGQPSGRFEPATEMTRGQVATVLAGLLELSGHDLPPTPPDAFSDDDGDVHEAHINQLAALGVISGTPDGRYLPGERIARDQLASLVHRTYAVAAGAPLTARFDTFTDDEATVHEGNVNALAGNGIVTGTMPQTFEPHADVSRGAAATVLARTIDLLVEIGRIQPRR